MDENEKINLIDEITQAVKNHRDVSDWKKNRSLSPFVNLISTLNSVPKNKVPQFDFSRIRNQILDRITVPVKATSSFNWSGFLRLSTGVLGALMITISLTMGAAVAALGSVPGQTIYPLKRVVENIHLKFTPEDDKASLQLKFANNRAEEIQSVLEKQQLGQLTEQETQAIVSATVLDLQKTTAAAASSKKPKAGIVNKLSDLTNKLRAASIHTEGEVRIEIEKAVESTQVSQEEAIKNIENAGIKIEDKPIHIESDVTASGKLTAVSETSVSIGSAKFLITKETKLDGLTLKELLVGIAVDIEGEIKDNKTYAQTITLVAQVKPSEETKTENPAPETTTETQKAQ